MIRTRFNRKIVPRSDSTGSFFSDEPITGNIVQGYFNGFFENGDSAAKLAAYLGDDLIEMEPYDNPSAGNGMGHSGIFVRFRTEHHLIDEIKAFVATLD